MLTCSNAWVFCSSPRNPLLRRSQNLLQTLGFFVQGLVWRLIRILAGLDILFIQLALALFFVLLFLGDVFLALLELIIWFCQVGAPLAGVPDSEC